MLKNILLIMLLLFAHGAIAQTSAATNTNAQDTVTTEETSKGYDALVWVSAELRQVIFKIYEGFSTIVSPLLYLVTALTILGVVLGYIINKPPHLFTVLSIFVTILLLRTLIMDSSQFNYWIYHPIEKVLFGLPSFIIGTVSDSKFSALSANPLENMFMQMDQTIGAMIGAAESIASKQGTFGGFATSFKAFSMMLVFFALQVVFSYVFLMAIWSIHMLLAAVPLALCLAVHPRTRKYIFNIINHGSVFLITPAIASIAMAITISMLNSLTAKAMTVIQDGGSTFPGDFFWHAMFLGVMSIFFHLKATSFASMIIGVGDTGFGQLFGTAVAAGAAAVSSARHGGINAAKGALTGAGIASGTPQSISGGAGYVVGKGGRLIYNKVTGGN